MQEWRRSEKNGAAVVVTGAVLVILLLAMIILGGCQGVQVSTDATSLPRPIWHEAPVWVVDVENGVAHVRPAENFAEAMLLMKQHIAELHAAPWWEGDKPGWLVEWEAE